MAAIWPKQCPLLCLSFWLSSQLTQIRKSPLSPWWPACVETMHYSVNDRASLFLSNVLPMDRNNNGYKLKVETGIASASSEWEITVLNNNELQQQSKGESSLTYQDHNRKHVECHCVSHMSTNHQFGDIRLSLQSSWSRQNDAVHIWQPQKYNGLQWSSFEQ